ncbi:hypothetical protein AWW68_05305 [Roseivirga spongicola]|uniref:Xylose isomerase-like TIM barrel domain-containing protein n=1 Tax=Roseivirga spongicola TaxID=333140 RepID=A0A150XHP3_9BACT|nr:hypothetical protein AWW68_05305 [Roseivirga spongicola]
MSIFVSSACIRERNLKKNVLELKRLGFRSVELTGGLQFSGSNISEIKNIVEQSDVSLQLHNYSPPVEKDFVLNMASLNEKTFQRSLSHVQSSLKLSEELNLGKYAVHAGFYIPIEADELGKVITKRVLYDRKESFERFVSTVTNLYSKGIGDLYIENNVVSKANFDEYGENPFMLTCADEYFELKERIPQLKILLDFAHLKVSCQSLGYSFEDEASRLVKETDYVHVSDNDGLSDSNQGVSQDSEMYEILKTSQLRGKTVTLEVYSGLEDLKRTYDLIDQLQ